jgi:XTP/dITP diphosphohydrolase
MIVHSGLEILVATANPGKVFEVEEALRSLPVKLRFLKEFSNIASVEEVGATYQENATLKAMGYADKTGVLALADDSGLEVDLLSGGPGVYSARLGGDHSSDSDRVQKLLNSLAKHEAEPRYARFVCCMALATSRKGGPNDVEGAQLLTVVEGTCEGTIALSPRGSRGFGFDPVFVPAGYSQTFAELPSEVKGEISHRAKALAAIREFLAGRLTQT